jgi:hypothetical protein
MLIKVNAQALPPPKDELTPLIDMPVVAKGKAQILSPS